MSTPDHNRPPHPLPNDQELVMKVIPMPADCNANGDIFGGWVMAQVDLAECIKATEASATVLAMVHVAEILDASTQQREYATSFPEHIPGWVTGRIAHPIRAQPQPRRPPQQQPPVAARQRRQLPQRLHSPLGHVACLTIVRSQLLPDAE